VTRNPGTIPHIWNDDTDVDVLGCVPCEYFNVYVEGHKTDHVCPHCLRFSTMTHFYYRHIWNPGRVRHHWPAAGRIREADTADLVRHRYCRAGYTIEWRIRPRSVAKVNERRSDIHHTKHTAHQRSYRRGTTNLLHLLSDIVIPVG